jgi:ferredoxin-NADP reductase
LSDAPGQPWWRISVKRQPNPAGHGSTAAAGSLSNWLHERIRVGDCLLVNGPCGEFVLDDAGRGPIVLMAAGIGITPLLSMLKHALHTHPARPVDVLFQVPDAEHWPFGETMHDWQASCSALSITSYFSRTLPADDVTHGQIQAGKFDAAAAIACVGGHAAASYYLCGPDPWMQTLVGQLTSLGTARQRIHYESFGGGPASQPTTDAASPIAPWSLSFARSGLHLATNSQSATIWGAASENGLKLPAVCHSGACGSCRLRLVSGQVQYRTPATCSLAEGEVLACITQPVGDVVVDA